MKTINAFAEGLGTGAGLIFLVAAATWLWKHEALDGWMPHETEQMRARRNWLRAERLAKNSPDYLDVCRVAGL